MTYEMDYWEFDFNKKIITLIGKLCSEQEAAVRLDAELSNSFDVNKGVRQGCILSPYLFSLYTEHVMRNVDDLRAGGSHEPKVNGVGMSEFRYADDQALLSKSQEGLKNMMVLWRNIVKVKDYIWMLKRRK